MKEKITIDFETRSEIDLKKQGLAVYAAHPSTEVICMAYAEGDKEVKLWTPGDAAPFDPEKYEIHAHNAAFEFAIWNQVCVKKYGWKKSPIENFFCNMAAGMAMGLPASLERLALALNLDVQKDMKGSRVMLQLSKPRKVHEDGSVTWWTKEDSPEKYETTYEYCKRDVEVERATSKFLKPLSDFERKLWLLDQKINQRGIKIDIESVLLAENIIENEKKRLNSEMRKLTSMEVSSCQAATQLAEYVRSYGVECDGVTKAEVARLLADEDTPLRVKKALKLRQEAAKSSTAKLKAMRLRASGDGRVRNTLQYHAAHTGRWGGRGIQLQNFPRPEIPQSEIDRAFGLFQSGDLAAEFINTFIGAPTDVVSDCLRGFISAEDGHELIVSDWSNIEGRVLMWLAGETWKIDAFKAYDEGRGPDLYILSYATSFHVNMAVAKENRQIGKVTELSMGYQGGVGAFQSMAVNYGVKVSDTRANEIKEAWRAAHPKTVQFWYALEDAAMRAVLNPNTTFKVGDKVMFRRQGGFLMCRLPSGRVLHYPSPKIENVTTPWGAQKDVVTYLSEDSMTKKWTRQKTYGGKLAENITQAVARDILAYALIKLDQKNYKIVGHVHDEVIIEHPEHEGNVKAVEELMCELPEWAEGLPLAAEGYRARRYRK